jgi:hypothetical protein
MIKASDRLVTGILTVALLFSPLSHLLRLVAELVSGDPTVTSSWRGFPWYVGALMLSYATALAMVAAMRLLHTAVFGGQSPVQRSLDLGVPGTWPWRYGLFLVVGAGAVLCVEGVQGRVAATAETLVASIALLVALAGPPAPRRAIESYDPLPYPDSENGDDVVENAGGRLPVSVTWGFCPVPGELGAPSDRHTIRLSVSADRIERYSTMREEPGSGRDVVGRVGDGICAELRDLAKQIRAISAAHRYDRIAELNNVLAMAAAVCEADEDEDGTFHDGDLPGSPRYPLEALLDDRGDGRDWGVLGAACLALLGYEVGLAKIDGRDSEESPVLAVAAPGELSGVEIPNDSLGRQWMYFEFDAESGRYAMLEAPVADLVVCTIPPVDGVIDEAGPVYRSESGDDDRSVS